MGDEAAKTGCVADKVMIIISDVDSNEWNQVFVFTKPP
jgi:hypothetical protein